MYCKKQNILFLLSFTLLFWGCSQNMQQDIPEKEILPNIPFLTVLGIAQDAGFPQVDCRKACCEKVWKGEQQKRSVSCLALVDPNSGKSYIFDATPDFKTQWQQLVEMPIASPAKLAGIFLTHAHVGHYTGLMQLGREIMGTKEVPVYAMPVMKNYLETNGPWSQLVSLKNISIQPLNNDSTIVLQNNIKVTPLQVPHRDEYSETVGYRIDSANKKILFIPDINKWELWEKDIITEIKKVDRAYLDGSFFQNGEIPGRDMSDIPHPFVVESMALFKQLTPSEKAKVHFIHFNHTNPILFDESPARKEVLNNGFNIADEGDIMEL
jgi:pyrroloquinoline quinone biosynthesis protein B